MSMWISTVVSSRSARKIGLATAVLIVSAGAAGAQASPPQPLRPDQYYGAYQSEGEGLALSRRDRAQFDHAGTRGRQGLGATSVHPEGPGNVTD